MDKDKIIASEVLRDIEKIKSELNDGITSNDYKVLEEKVKTSAVILDELADYCRETIGSDHVIKMSLNIFLKDAISMWKKKFWSIDISGTSQGSIDIECSKLKLKRAFENLILNSMEAGASEVIIDVSKNQIQIIDNGEGITPDDSNQIEEQGTTKGRNRGIGLKMVKGFFLQHGWVMELKNNQDQGLSVILKKDPA